MSTATVRHRAGTPTGALELRTTERRGARLAGWSLLAMTVVVLPAAVMLGRDDQAGTRVALATAFGVVAVLDLAAGIGLYGLLGVRAHSSAYASLVSRAGYAVLLTAAAARLAWPGGGGVDTFRADWSLALVVLGLNLVVTALALRASRLVPALVVAATALTGAASVVDESLTRWADVAWRPMLGPLLLGELVLTGWLLVVAHRRPAPAVQGLPGPGC